MEEYSAKNIVLIAHSQITLRHVQAIADAFIVSTSYEHYIKALCKAVDFPYKNTYCTRLSLDKCGIAPKEKERLREVAQEIAQMNTFYIPQGSKTTDDFSDNDQAAIHRLDEIFWNEIPRMFVGKFLNEVVTVGGEQKAEAIQDAVNRLGKELADVMYVGDSITDVEAFKLVRASGGLTVSFNGNSYAVRNAEVVVLSESSIITAVIADLFCRFSKEQTLNVLEGWGYELLKNSGVDPPLLRQLSQLPDALPKAKIVSTQNVEMLIKESSEFRNKVRGVDVGNLG
jgi:energy-converting hydrogenase A subunit R